MNCKGEPYVIEYNCRMGDPETEVVVPRIKSDLLELFEAVGKQTLNEIKIELDTRTAVTVMLVSGGYPGDFEKGKIIIGIENVTQSLIFLAGTKIEGENIVTNGGRVMAITSYGNTIEEAVGVTMKKAERINFDNKYYRKDIGKDLMNRD